MDIRPVHVEQILPLRHAVLRAGRPREAAKFDGDDEPATFHLAAIESQRVIGCLTLIDRACDGESAWQLRGMAIAPDHRSSGIGGQMLQYLESKLRREGPHELMWCNARTPVIAFYEKHGWQTVSGEFHVPDIGPHRRMTRRLKREHPYRRFLNPQSRGP